MRQLTFHIITSKKFWSGAPLLIIEIVKRGHYLSTFDENALPAMDVLLTCDVFIDMSTITDPSFYLNLEKYTKQQKKRGLSSPFMIDPPMAILDSFDKSRTHKMFPELVPESYDLNGVNNSFFINKFISDEFVVVKPSVGWWGKDVERLTPGDALKKYAHKSGLIVQKYIPAYNRVGRILTLNHGDDFQIICNYERYTKAWRTGVDVEYFCYRKKVSKRLKEFSKIVSKRCGLYLNGIDYLMHDGGYVLLEVNAVPAIKEPTDEFKINVSKQIVDHIERSIL